MLTAEILKKLQDVFRNVFSNPNLIVLPETSAQDIEEWDSLTHVTLILAIEKEFGIKFSLGELHGLSNVSDLLNLIEKKNV